MNRAFDRDDRDRLYNLLPVVYRQRDAEIGEPLRELLRVISEQVDVVEADIAQLYENWFIETCQDWVVPYIGDLIGYRPIHDAGEPGEEGSPGGRARNRVLIPRREVANTLRYRRRKGTLALLARLAEDVTGWPARAVEFSRLISSTQAVNDPLPKGNCTVDLRDHGTLDALNTPFEGQAHGVDVRRISSHRTPGRYGPANVGLFVARLKAYPVTRSVAYCVEEEGDHCFTFSPLGHNTSLFSPRSKTDEKQVGDELGLPGPIRRPALEERTIVDGVVQRRASAQYYGVDRSFAIWATDWGEVDPLQPIPRELIIPTDLSRWQYRPRAGHVAVDPELGRIAFPPDNLPAEVEVSYFYGFSDDVGGGEYYRALVSPPRRYVYRVGARGNEAHDNLREALGQWQEQRPRHAVIEITDSQTYDEERIHIELEGGQYLEIRAIDGARPVIRLLNWEAGRPDALVISGKGHGHLVLDGLLIVGRGIQVMGEVTEIALRHCTLVPGWVLHQDGAPRHAHEASLMLRNTSARAVIYRSILGPVRVQQDERQNEPNAIEVTDSIVDAMGWESHALASSERELAYATLTFRRSTVFGQIHTHAIESAENCIFEGVVRVAKRQQGYMRFSYVPSGSRTPLRYECQPDLVGHGLRDLSGQSAELMGRPVFNSRQYGTSTYCQLADDCPAEIRKGADDESEMGVFHNLFQPQREANLGARLEEYLPARFDANVVHVT